MTPITLTCHNCSTPIEVDDQLSRSATCDKCGSYLRCCLNCRFYDAAAYNACREPQAERVKEKEQANFCSFFEVASATRSRSPSKKEDALKKLNDLFKKPGD